MVVRERAPNTCLLVGVAVSERSERTVGHSLGLTTRNEP